MATKSGIIVSVLDLNGNEIFSQLEGIEQRDALRTSQVTPGTKIKILVRFPKNVQMYGAAGFRMIIAIDQVEGKPSLAQTYWYDATDLHTAEGSYCCFYVWPDAANAPNAQPVKHDFMAPTPDKDGLKNGTWPLSLEDQRGCIIVSLTRGHAVPSRVEEVISCEPSPATDKLPGLQKEVQKSPKVIHEQWFTPLPGDLGRPTVWAFRNVSNPGIKTVKVSSAIQNIPKVRPEGQEGGTDVMDDKERCDEGEDRLLAHAGTDHQNSETEPEEQRLRVQTTNFSDPHPDDMDLENALWLSLLESLSPAEREEILRGEGQQKHLRWLERTNPVLYNTYFRQGKLEFVDGIEEAHLKEAIMNSKVTKEKHLDDKVADAVPDQDGYSSDLDDSLPPTEGEEEALSRSTDGESEELAELVDAVRIEGETTEGPAAEDDRNLAEKEDRQASK